MAAQPHPYAAAWQPWDERYEQHLKSKRNWQIACGLSSLASVILAGGMVYQSTKARYIPFVCTASIIFADRDNDFGRLAARVY